MVSKSKRINITKEELVRQGYDKISHHYLENLRSDSDANRHTLKYLNLLSRYLKPKAKVLDLGCGAGVPATQFLASYYQVVGVDISEQQLKLARKNVPSATFLQADMLSVKFPANSFAAVICLYAIIHLPREHHRQVIGNIYKFLKPGGYLLITMGVVDTPEIQTDNWLGAPMYWSFFDKKTNLKLLQQAGFTILRSKVEVEREETGLSQHLYVLCQKD